MQAIISVHYRKTKTEIELMSVSEVNILYEWLTWFKRKEAQAVKNGTTR